MNKEKIRLDGRYQRAVDEFVRKNVIYCVSSLVHELAKENNQEALELGVRWGSESELSFRCNSCDLEWFETEEFRNGVCLTGRITSVACPECNRQTNHHHRDQYESSVDVYEHWIVSDWLADKLQERGETVNKDFYGLTIWGRTITGQQIYIDGIICDIFDEFRSDLLRQIEEELRGQGTIH